MSAVFESDIFERLEGFLFVRHAVEILSQHYIFERVQIRDQMKLLEHKSDLLRSHSV